jgi:Ribose/xylose/arabinose/galactoside ABC-type transport systems, permease components
VSLLGVVLALVLIMITLSMTTGTFFTGSNLSNIARQSVWVGVMAVGMVFVLGTEGIDLSVGSVLSLTGVVVAAIITSGYNIFLALILGLAFGVLVGLINGLLITKVSLPPFIATLGMMSVLQGVAYVYTQGIPIYGLQYREVQMWAQGFVGPIPVPVLILLIVWALGFMVLTKTPYGRYVLSVGSNENAANLVGISVDRIKISVYAISGFLAALAGILLASRSEAAVPTAGAGYEMDVIAAAVIGGTAMSGGIASVSGAVIGSVLMTTIRNGLNLLGVSSLWHQVVMGILILLAVAIGSWRSSGSRGISKSGAMLGLVTARSSTDKSVEDNH